jgi:hypothetical protein
VGNSGKQPTRSDASHSVKWDVCLKLIAVLLALPGFVVQVCNLAGFKLPIALLVHAAANPKWVNTLFLISLSSFLWLGRGILRFLFRPLLDFLAQFRLNSHQQQNSLRAAYHFELMRDHPRLLSMTYEELAKEARIFWWEADFVMRNPDFIPRSDIEETIRQALMVGPDWPPEYGSNEIRKRLIWYYRKGYSVLTAEKVERLTEEARKQVLEEIEQRRRYDLERGLK